MYWPRLKLTDLEKSFSIGKYYDPSVKYRVLRKTYTGTLTLSAVQRRPTFGFAIARRCRIFAMTASGDIHQFRLQVQDSSGEQYIPDSCAAGGLFGGFNMLPPSDNLPASPFAAVGLPLTLAPFVFEPNITLDPNQVLNLIGEAPVPYNGNNYHIEVCFHVWEFPAMFGTSPQ